MTNPFDFDLEAKPLPLLAAADPRLRQRSDEVTSIDPTLLAEASALIATLRDFKARSGFGRAISAVQVGVLKRLVAMDLGSGPFLLVNPEITWRSEETFHVWDDCLSIPDVLVRVRRHRSVSLTYSDHRLQPQRWNDLPPDLSELIQHEIDHLDGVLMTDRAEGEDAVQPMSRRSELVGSEALRLGAAMIDPAPHVPRFPA